MMARCLLALTVYLSLSTAAAMGDEGCVGECAAVTATRPSTEMGAAEEEEDIEEAIRMKLLQLNLNVVQRPGEHAHAASHAGPGNESLVQKKGGSHTDVRGFSRMGPSNASLVQEQGGRRASCSSPANFDVSMACIANAVYFIPSGEKTVPGWDLVAEAVDHNSLLGLGSGTDKMGIYRDGQGNCALSISGSDDVNDWIQDFSFIPKSGCNLDMHAGFYDELTRLTAGNPLWPGIKQFLQQNCEKTFFVGHSLGGALASALAACIEAGTEPALQGVPFHGLYTFGAPAIARQAAATADGGCFPGKRFFNLYALNGGDPVPAATDLLWMMKHPKMKGYRLINSFWWGDTRVEVLDCNDPNTWREPHFGIGPRPFLHVMSEYIQNMDAML